MLSDLVPLFAIVFLFGAPVAAWIVSRILAHQERMEMIRRGFVPPPDSRAARQAARMGWQAGPMPPPPGMQTPPFGNVPPPGGFYDPSFYAQAQMRKGITVMLVGFALLIGLSFIGIDGQGSLRGGPWLLGGLIPMFVGIAQIINALLNGARLPGFMGGAPRDMDAGMNFGPRPAPGPGPAPSPPPSEPYAGWRPGPTPEIEKPTPPPDRR